MSVELKVHFEGPFGRKAGPHCEGRQGQSPLEKMR